MAIGNRLIELLEEAKENRLIVTITETDHDDLLLSVLIGDYTESCTVSNIEHLIRRLEWIIDDYRIV